MALYTISNAWMVTIKSSLFTSDLNMHFVTFKLTFFIDILLYVFMFISHYA